MTNADFSSTTGWTQDHSSSYWSLGNGNIGTYAVANDKKSTTDATHLATEQCFGMQCRWKSNYAAFTQTTSTLPAGAYTLTFDVQNTNSSTTSATYANRFTVKVGETTYTDSKTEWMQSSPTWTTHTIEFTINEAATATISLGYGTGSNNYASGNTPHLYVSHLKLTVVPFADATDYANLKTAISTVEGTTWGFDAGEYAPYNYVEVIEALAQAKAIDQTTNNSQTTVRALTATLNTSMTANAAEVNAIWDPSFEHSYSTEGNVQPIAWTGTSGHNNATDVRWMWNVSSNAGLAATSSSKALFTKYGAFYGETTGYTLPLNASTYYTIGFKYGGWSDCKKDGYVTVIDAESASLTLVPSKNLPLDAVNGNSNTESWKNYQAIFKTNAAGNYVLGLRKNNESQQSQYVYGDFVLKLTTVAEATSYYNDLKTTLNSDYEAEVYGGTEKTAFKSALDAAVPSTVAEIMTAAADLQTKHDTYVAAKPSYNKYYTERTRAIAMGVNEKDIADLTIASNMQTLINNIVVLEDAATANYGIDATEIFGTWTPQNTSSASGQHWSGDGRSYIDKNNNDGFTMSVTNTVTLPAGSYVFKAAARAALDGVWPDALTMQVTDQPNAIFNPCGNTGYGIDINGHANYSDEGTYANNDLGRGWEWRFIPFTLNESKEITMKIEAIVKGGNWASFSDITLLTTSDNIGICQRLWTAAKTAAEEARDNETYAKVDGAEKKALTDALTDAETEPSTSTDYQTQTAALKTATANFTATATVTAYNRWDAAKTEATAISFTHSYAVENTTTAAEALDYANGLYTDMFNAKKTAKAQGDKVLGFQNGEYAPYNNTEVIAALNAADAITDVATTETATLDAAISGLNAASDWTANSGDVDAIYNGTFAETGTGNNPKGWSRSNGGWGQQITGLTAATNGVNEGTTTAWYYNNNGAWQYGNEGVYTMPLAASMKYVLTFKYAKHGSDGNNWMKASVQNEEKEGLEVVQYPGSTDNIMYKTAKAYFTTGKAGNYLLSIEQSGNVHLTDVSLVKAASTAKNFDESSTTYIPELAYYETVTLTRTLSAEYWNTFSVPFDAAIPDGWSVYEFDGATDNVINFKTATSFVAGKPYLVKPTTDAVNPTFENVIVQSTEGLTDGTGDYKFAAQIYNKSLAFDGTIAYLSTSGDLKILRKGGIKGLRAYFIIPAGGSGARISFGDDETTGISDIRELKDNGRGDIYDLQGRKVTTPSKGIYVVNGKKVVRK